MLFEKTIRKKKIPPYYLELIMGSIYVSLVLNGFFLFLEFSDWDPSFYLLMIGIHILATIGSIATILAACLPLDVIVFDLIKDRKRNRIIVSDVRIIIYMNYPINIAAPGTPGWNTFLGYNFMEPFLQIIDFTAHPLGTEQVPPLPIKFFIPAVYFSYRKQKDYKAIKSERKSTKAEAKEYDLKQCDYNYDPQVEIDFELYLTYAKMKELNKLFELVNPPEFRITTYEKSGVFISMEPIPGREYPPEALECMEKINAMYP